AGAKNLDQVPWGNNALHALEDRSGKRSIWDCRNGCVDRPCAAARRGDVVLPVGAAPDGHPTSDRTLCVIETLNVGAIPETTVVGADVHHDGVGGQPEVAGIRVAAGAG